MIAIGIDIGGTSIKYAAVDSTGKVYEKEGIDIVCGEDQNFTISNLIFNIKNYIAKYNLEDKICGIGIGIPGSIDTKEGVVTYSNNLKWKELHIVEMFKKEFNMPIKITNDANAAALGEKVFGAGKKYKDVVMITLGTGVGSGIIIDGKIYEGLNGKGAEIGHSTLVMDGLKCTCGRKAVLKCMQVQGHLFDKQKKLWKKMKLLSCGKKAKSMTRSVEEWFLTLLKKVIKLLMKSLIIMSNTYQKDY